MLKKLFFILIVIASEFILSGAEGKQSHAQPSKTDSLLSLLKTDKEDTNKVNHLNGLAREMELSGDYEKGINYAGTSFQRKRICL